MQITVDEADTYDLRIRTAEGFYDQPVSVRLHQSLLPEHYEIRLLQDGKEFAIESRVMGSYVVFDLEHPCVFRVVKVSPQIPVRYYIMGVGALLLVLILVIRRLIKCRKAKQAGCAAREHADSAGKDQEVRQKEEAAGDSSKTSES